MKNKDVLLITDESHNYKNYLVVYDTGKELKIKYKGKSKTILNKDNYNNINRLYDLNYVSSDKSAYVGGYKAQTDIIDGKPFYVYMYLRSDGTYTYGNNTASGARNVGTYEIKDRKILLHDIVSYGSDACYFTDESYLFDITMTIKDGITLYDEKSKETFSKDSSIKESSYEIARYVTNPIDGKKPTQDDDEWLHCNADGSLVNPKYE